MTLIPHAWNKGPDFIQYVEPTVPKYSGLSWYDLSTDELKVWSDPLSAWIVLPEYPLEYYPDPYNRGFIVGGFAQHYQIVTQDIIHCLFNADSTPARVLSYLKDGGRAGTPSAFASSRYGYVAGGILSPTLEANPNSGHRINFSMYYMAVLLNELYYTPLGPRLSNGVSSSSAGYTMGYVNSSNVNVTSIAKFMFADETSIDNVGNVTDVTTPKAFSSCSSSQRGYVSYYATDDVNSGLPFTTFIAFASDTTGVGPNLSGGVSQGVVSTMSTLKGYVMSGGSTTFGDNTTTMYQINFADNTANDAAITLTVRVKDAAAFRSVAKGYIVGGIAVNPEIPPSLSTLHILNFSNVSEGVHAHNLLPSEPTQSGALDTTFNNALQGV